jgi:hypothetical protein
MQGYVGELLVAHNDSQTLDCMPHILTDCPCTRLIAYLIAAFKQ